MKHSIIIKVSVTAFLVLALASCEKFLNRPAEDNYNVSNFYKTDAQLEEGVNYLYNSPWYDFQRGFFKVGEIMSGNMYGRGEDFTEFAELAPNGTTKSVKSMAYSLWAVNGHANTVISNILNSEGPSQAAKNKYIGEALVWKAFAYFFMVRTFGEVPIIHDNTTLINSGEYNQVYKVTKANVYEYIIITLEKALELLPKQTGNFNDMIRIDYYAAEALLAKVYLTKAGVGGSITSEAAIADLKKAADYAKDVIENSGRSLDPSYNQIFRLKDYNATGECLISWMWSASRSPWTQQNTLQSDLAMAGFDENGDCWGGWSGPSVDLMDAFGVDPADDPIVRKNEKDVRRKASMMMAGDYYEWFWTDKGGFDWLRFIYDTDYGKGGPGGQMQCQTGATNCKHLYGDNYDHQQATGIVPPAEGMAYQLPTHLLRLSDVYLIYAEASILTGHADIALEYTNLVRERAGIDDLPSITWNDIWKERRLELAGECDRWYDFVRRSYYDFNAVKAELEGQRRSYFEGLDKAYKLYVYDDNGKYTTDGKWVAVKVDEPITGEDGEVWYNNLYDNIVVTKSSFTIPFPTEDVVFNANMAADAEVVEVENMRETYKYNF